MNLAAWTYSRSLIDIVRLRTTRADSIQPKAASSTTSSNQEYGPFGPPVVMTAMSKNDGMTSSRSMTHSAIRSNQPPKYAANEPTMAAMPVERIATRKPISSDLRRPRRVRASMSRPLWVVPSGCVSLGGFR